MRRVLLVFVLIAVLSGCVTPHPQVIIHQYHPQAVPPPAPGGVPVAPPGPPQPVPYPTVHGEAPFSDPTVAIVRNEGDDTLLFSIDGKESVMLPPGVISANINVGPGEHSLRWWALVRTTHPDHPVLKSREQLLFFWVRAEERTKVFSLRIR